jgi:protein-S-isoprenylcysteine O-methyltransferase Ste14
VWFPPPLVFAAALGIGTLLDRWRPLPLGAGVPGAGIEPTEIIAVALGAAGLGLMLWAALTFRRARTTVLPDRGATALAFGGPYRFTRNPMYVGMTAVSLALTFVLATAWPLLTLPLALLIIDRWVIGREEQHLVARFGADYEAYRRRVRRWI